MTNSTSRPPLSLAEQLGGNFPEGATAYRLIHTAGGPSFPDVNKVPYPKNLRLQPPGMVEGDYYVEFYDEEGKVIPDEPGEPVVVSFWRRKPAAQAPMDPVSLVPTQIVTPGYVSAAALGRAATFNPAASGPALTAGPAASGPLSTTGPAPTSGQVSTAAPVSTGGPAQTAGPAATPEPAAAPGPATAPAGSAAAASASTPAKPDPWSANPDRWAHTMQVRQDHQMRDLGVAVFHQGIEQLKEIRDLYATMGQEQYKNQRIALDYGKEVFALQRTILEERKGELEKQSQAKENPAPAQAKVDYTALGQGLIGAAQAIVIAIASRRSEPRAEEPERTKRHEKEPRAAATGQKVLLVPEAQAEQTIGELLKFGNPFELQRLLGDPAEQKKFAARIGEIIGSPEAPQQTQLARRPGGGAK